MEKIEAGIQNCRKRVHICLAVAFAALWGFPHAHALDIDEVQEAVNAANATVTGLDWTGAELWSGNNTATPNDFTKVDDDGVLTLSDFGAITYTSFIGNYQNSGPAGNMIVVDYVSGGATVTGNVYGGLIGKTGGTIESADRNVVKIESGGEILGTGTLDPNPSASVYGGYVGSGSGNAKQNIVLIENGAGIAFPLHTKSDSGGIYGGYINGTGTEVSGNIVKSTGGIITKNIYGGGSGESATASTLSVRDNIVILEIGSGEEAELYTPDSRAITGGHSVTGTAANNIAYIDTATNGGKISLQSSAGYAIAIEVYGGYTGKNVSSASIAGGAATGNFVYLNDNSYDLTSDIAFHTVTGGVVSCGDAAAVQNTVMIKDGAATFVRGGTAGEGAVTGNKVVIEGGQYYVIAGGINGSISNGIGNVTSNTVSLSGTTRVDGSQFNNVIASDGSVYGGIVSNADGSKSGSAKLNQVTLSDSVHVFGGVFGGVLVSRGAAGKGVVNDNKVAISGTASSMYVIGGQSDGVGAITENKVNISSTATFAGDALLGLAGFGLNGSGSAVGGFSTNTVDEVLVKDNTVTISAGKYSEGIIGGYSVLGSVDNNTITMTGGEAQKSVIAGYGVNGNTTKNKVYLTSTRAGGGVGTYVAGSFADSGNATGNLVEVTNGTIDADIAAGIAVIGKADANTLILTGATVTAGHAVAGGAGLDVPGFIASNNKVYIENATIHSAIWGGYAQGGGAAGVGRTNNNEVYISGYKNNFDSALTSISGGSNESIGNKLFTTSASGMTVSEIANFSYYEFNLTGNDIGTTIYSVSNSPVDLAGADVHLNLDSGNAYVFKKGDAIRFFSDTTGTPPDAYTATINDTVFNYDGEFFLGASGSPLNFTITDARQKGENITYGQAQLAGLQMTNIASDFARNISSLYHVAEENVCDPLRGGPLLFAGIGGGASRWNTGGDSKTNLNHMSLLTGLGWRSGGLLLAGYFEAGWGKYDAKLNGGRKQVDGEKTDYIGGGVVARYETGGFYSEAGFHAGRLKTDYEARMDGARVKYDTSAAYYGVDAVVGYQVEAGCSTVDISARYSWNHVNGDDFDIAPGRRIEEDAVNSHRVRAGAEWSYNMGSFRPYAGAYYEYEFDAKSKHRDRLSGVSLTEAKMKGSSGIGEIGVRFGGGENRVSVDLGVEGYVGKRRGVAGKALIGYSF